MGFKIEVNSILRQDLSNTTLEVGQEYPFRKDPDTVVMDSIPIWLTSRDWTAMAEIQVTSQTRTPEQTVGTFVVLYLYNDQESAAMTKVFKRMYGW